MIIKQLHVDLWQKILQPITVVQHEAEGRRLAITLTGGGLPVNLTGCDVIFYAQKPDENILFNNCDVIDAAAGQVEYTITGQTVVLVGTLKCWIVVIKDGKTIRSQEFHITVQESPDFTGAVESTSEFTDLEVALATIAGFDARLTAVEGDLANYLPLSGGSLTGDLDINGNAVWHAGNLHNSTGLCDLYLYGATTAGNPTYSTQYSEYTRVGDQVDISFYFQLTNLGGMDGGIRVGNLPFESDSTSSASTTQLHVSNITRAGIIAVAAQVVAGSTYALLRIMYETSGTISEGALAASHMANDTMIKGIISYKAA